MSEPADRTAVITDNEVWIRHDDSPRASGDERWIFVGDIRELDGWIERGCPDKPHFRPPAYPWSRVVRDPKYWPHMGGRRKAEPVDDQTQSRIEPVFEYL